MSGLADILLSRGQEVSGSDLRLNYLTERLSKKGATICGGHCGDNVPAGADCVVRTACIKDDNPELLRAGELGIKVITRSELLKILIDESRVSVSVTGTHGKTTTSGLVAHIAEKCGKSPTSVIGGELESIGGNAKYGQSGVMIAELDESDGFFRNVGCSYGIVTNIEREHMEYYGSMESLLEAYGEFISRISPDGIFFYNGEDRSLVSLAGRTKARKSDFGIDGHFRVTCSNYVCRKSIEFDLAVRGRIYGRVKSPLIGRHNLMNILAAISVCLELGIDFKDIASALETFHGAGRRFDRIARIGDIEVVEDYAHHPTELMAVIRAAKNYGEGRVISIFQPHRYSRTNDLADGFVRCFNDSDVLILTDVYSADEKPVEGVKIRDIYDRIDRSKFEMLDFVKKEEIPDLVSRIVRDKDLVLVLGAGDIREISAPLIEMIEKRQGHG